MEVTHFLVYIFFFALTWKFYSFATVNDKLSVSKVDRTIDISSQLAKIVLEITLENGGPDAAKSFLIGVDSKLANHLAYASATVSNLDFKHCFV